MTGFLDTGRVLVTAMGNRILRIPGPRGGTISGPPEEEVNQRLRSERGLPPVERTPALSSCPRVPDFLVGNIRRLSSALNRQSS
jgi:hypothetical protein